MPVGTATVVVGWNPPGQQTLQQLNAPLLHRDLCNSPNITAPFVHERMLCSGPLTANTGTCIGARGGGLYFGGRVVGILSNNFGCGTVNTPSVYTEVC